MMEIDTGKGSVHASSSLSHGPPIKGFSQDPAHFWWSGWKSSSAPYVAMIWFDFGRQPDLAPAKISFQPPQQYYLGWAKDYFPTKWQFVGSNDAQCSADGDWKVLCEDLSGKELESLKETRSCKVRAGSLGRCHNEDKVETIVHGLAENCSSG